MLTRAGSVAGSAAAALRVLARAGLLAPVRPDRLPGMAMAVARYGLTPTAAFVAGAARHGDRVAIVDDSGPTTYAELDARSNAAAHALHDAGIAAGDRVALLARNSVEFLLALIALGKLGATVVHLNTGFAGPALARALDDERVAAVVHDREFADLVAESVRDRTGITTEDLTADANDDRTPLPAPGTHGGQVILTSGTTGQAKGAERGAPAGLGGLESLTALLSAIPLRAGEPTVLAAPMFHTWGFAHLVVGGLLGSTLVVRRRFDAAATVADLAERDSTRGRAGDVAAHRRLAGGRTCETRHLRVAGGGVQWIGIARRCCAPVRRGIR